MCRSLLIILDTFFCKIVRRGSRTSPLIKNLFFHLFVMLRLHYHDWRGAGFGCRKMKNCGRALEHL